MLYPDELRGQWSARFDLHTQESYSYTRLEHPVIQRNVILRAQQAYYLYPSLGELLVITAILTDNGAESGIRTQGTVSHTPVFKTGALNQLDQLCIINLSSATFFYVIVGNIQRIVRLLPTSKNFFGLYIIILYSQWCPLQDLNL